MRVLGTMGVVFTVGWLCGVPAVAHDCWHHNCGRDGGWNCGRNYSQSRNRQPRCGQAANLQTLEGKIGEVVYLPGATAESGMVEIRILAAGQAKLVRLAPASFLKQGGVRLREGDVVTAKVFAVAAMEGDLLVATEVRQGGTTLALRDGQGRPVW